MEEDDLLELKSGEKIMGAGMTEGMPAATGKVGDKCVKVLRDTGCNEVIIKRDLVSQKGLTQNEGYMMTVYRTPKKVRMARNEVDTPYFVGKVDALCLREPLFDLIIGNIQGAGNSNDLDPNWGIVAATIRPTRAQAQQEGNLKPLQVK